MSLQKTFSILFFLFSFSAWAFDFNEFNEILKNHVQLKELKEGGLQSSFAYQNAFNDQNVKRLVEKQKEKLKEFNVESLSSKNQALSFWINSYNFFMIVTVLEKGFENGQLNIDSVKDFGSLFNPYKIFKQNIHSIGGEKYSLDQMEKEILLGEDFRQKGWKDARIHFAVNCASVGCPPLLNQIYTAESLDQTLDSNLSKAFKTSRHLSVAGNTLKLTSLFKWYKKDFEEDSGSIKAFIKKYVDEDTFKSIQQTNSIQYIDYNWSLNSPKNF